MGFGFVFPVDVRFGVAFVLLSVVVVGVTWSWWFVGFVLAVGLLVGFLWRSLDFLTGSFWVDLV